MSDGVVELKVNGAVYGGWTRVLIRTSIEQVAGSFELEVTERWSGLSAPSPIHRGDACVLLVDGVALITGYIDEVDIEYDDVSHTVRITGRDKTSDLVDCSAIWKSGQWKKCKIDKIAADICHDFGIKVIVQSGVDIGDPLPAFGIQIGERAFETLDRAARMRALLLMTDGLGNLVIGRAGSERIATELVEGLNIKRASGKFDFKDRFSVYIVKGQRQGSDSESPASYTQVSGSATDDTVARARKRPIVILAEDQGHISSFKARAEWERNIRMGRSNRATITVQGWKHSAGVWRHNRIVHLRSPLLYADIDVLIVSVTYRVDTNGTTAELELVRPEAFDLISGVKGTRLDRAISDKNRTGAAVRSRGDTKKVLAANTGAGNSSMIAAVNQGEGWQ